MTRAQDKWFGWMALVFAVLCFAKWLGFTHAEAEALDAFYGAIGFIAAWLHLKQCDDIGESR